MLTDLTIVYYCPYSIYLTEIVAGAHMCERERFMYSFIIMNTSTACQRSKNNSRKRNYIKVSDSRKHSTVEK